MLINRSEWLAQFVALREQASDPDRFLESEIGGDLWVDGLNVLLTVEAEEFLEALETFTASYAFNPHSKTDSVAALQRYALAAARADEFQLYQALALGITWLSLQEEVHAQFFNLPVKIANHSVALLLSPTYLSIWAHAYNAGITLFLDLDTHRLSTFRPEHGRIYQNGRTHIPGRTILYPFQSYHHEMAHILLFHDLYPRVLGASVAEDTTAFAHMETSISCTDELILSELLAVREDLNLIDDGYMAYSTFPEYGAFRFEVLQGLQPPVTRRSLALYRKHFVLCAQDEDCRIEDNPIKSQLLESHTLSSEEVEIIRPHFANYLHDQEMHANWAMKAARRNRIPTYREVIELLPIDAYCLQKWQECRNPDAWTDATSLLSSRGLPELNPELRRRNQQLWEWRELFYRLAEIRGYLEQNFADAHSPVQQSLLALAKRIASVIQTRMQVEHPQSPEEHGTHYEALSGELAACLAELAHSEARQMALQMMEHPFTFLLEPR